MYAIDLNRWVKRYNKTDFILLFLFIFFLLSVVVSFVKFIAQWPVLILVSLFVSFIIYNALKPVQEQDPYYRNSKTYVDLLGTGGAEGLSDSFRGVVENVMEGNKNIREGMNVMKLRDSIKLDSLLFQGDGEEDENDMYRASARVRRFS